MKKVIFCITLALSGMMTACVEKNEAVDADSKPSLNPPFSSVYVCHKMLPERMMFEADFSPKPSMRESSRIWLRNS